MTTTIPRPPDGDWLGTPFLRFEREGPFTAFEERRSPSGVHPDLRLDGRL
jgi:hypothetical protein